MSMSKSTQIARAAAWLRARGVEVVLTREPGGTPRAERLRTLLLERDAEPMPQSCELLLMFAMLMAHVGACRCSTCHTQRSSSAKVVTTRALVTRSWWLRGTVDIQGRLIDRSRTVLGLMHGV